MIDTQPSPSQVAPRDETPDSLMSAFRGRGLATILLFTLVVHVVVLGGSSVPFLWRSIFGEDTSELGEAERIKAAVEEATPVLREIAEKHGLNPQQLSSQFAGGGSRAAKVAESSSAESAAQPAGAAEPLESSPQEPEKPKSALEKELDVKLEGPKQPSLEDEKDIF